MEAMTPSSAEARNVGGVDQLHMLHPVAGVAAAIGAERRLITVEHDPHRAIADGMDGDLQAAPVSLDGDLGEAGGFEQRLAAPAGTICIVIDQHGGAGFDDAIDEELDEAGAQHVRGVAGGHVARLLQHAAHP